MADGSNETVASSSSYGNKKTSAYDDIFKGNAAGVLRPEDVLTSKGIELLRSDPAQFQKIVDLARS